LIGRARIRLVDFERNSSRIFLREALGEAGVVRLQVSNEGTEPLLLLLYTFKLVDETGRTFVMDPMNSGFLTGLHGAAALFLGGLNPGLSGEAYLVFDLPPEAQGLQLRLGELLQGEANPMTTLSLE
jgi:hypothetical protein